MIRRFAPLLPLVAGACSPLAQDTPSLLPRPIEQVGFDEPERPAVVAAPDPVLDRAIGAQRAAVAEAQRAFGTAERAADAATAAAANDRPGSERWLDAQVALATLDVARTAIDVPRAELERLAIARAADGLPPYPALETALAETVDSAERQRTRIAALSARLR